CDGRAGVALELRAAYWVAWHGVVSPRVGVVGRARPCTDAADHGSSAPVSAGVRAGGEVADVERHAASTAAGGLGVGQHPGGEVAALHHEQHVAVARGTFVDGHALTGGRSGPHDAGVARAAAVGVLQQVSTVDGHDSHPCRCAMWTAWARLAAPSLTSMRATWVLTVSVPR